MDMDPWRWHEQKQNIKSQCWDPNWLNSHLAKNKIDMVLCMDAYEEYLGIISEFEPEHINVYVPMADIAKVTRRPDIE